MNHAEMLTELNRQLKTGEATRQQYTDAIDLMEGEMIDMHTYADYDVLRYMQCEATANVYREALGLQKTDITERAKVSTTLTDGEYKATIKAEFAESPRPPRRHSGQRWEECPICGREPVCNDCGYCHEKHCTGG